MFLPESLLRSRYRIICMVGEGTQGKVYHARDQLLNRVVALKAATYSDDFPEELLSDEARLLASLGKHPNLPAVFDCFSEENCQVLVMEFIPGDDLATLLRKTGQAFEISHVLKWADDLLRALEFMHNHKPPIIHRDIKPQNMKLNEKGEMTLLDFGLAKDLTTGTRVSGFTPNYAPLEQLRGFRTDARSDLYSLAASLYHLATNVKPIDAITRESAVSRGFVDVLPAPHEIKNGIPRGVSLALMQALSIEAERRPSSARELRGLLQLSGETAASENQNEIPTLVSSLTRTDLSEETRVANHSLLGRVDRNILALAFAPHGELVASGSWDRTIRLWNLTTRRDRILARCDGPVNSVCFSPDGRLLASASNTIEIWEVESGKRVRRFNQFGFCVVFSPKGQFLAWSCKADSSPEGAICTWDIDADQAEVLGTSKRWIRSLAFSPDGRNLVSGTWDFSEPLTLWNVQTKQYRCLLERSEHGVDDVAISSDGRFIAAGGKVITLLDVVTDDVYNFGTYDDGIYSIAFSPDGKTIVSGGSAICIWSVERGDKRILQKSDVHINAVAFSPDGNNIAAGGNDGGVYLLNAKRS